MQRLVSLFHNGDKMADQVQSLWNRFLKMLGLKECPLLMVLPALLEGKAIGIYEQTRKTDEQI